jgi:predicted RNA-binding Zn-ribbon protein involved in translation (DUF1610 family)
MKILLLDIETAPNLAHVWGMFKQTIHISQLIEASYVLCWAAKWLEKDEVYFDSMECTKSPAKMLKGVHKLLEDADAVVTYNGESFDLPVLNKEFLQATMFPPAPYKSIDLYQTAKRKFRFPSNKLEYIARALKLPRHKIKHAGHQLWVDVMAGDPEAWTKMEEYNKGDVLLLEDVYFRMRPWVRNHPNMATHLEPGVHMCPACGSTHLQARGWRRTEANKYQRFQCMDCGKWSTSAQSEFSREDRASILRNHP